MGNTNKIMIGISLASSVFSDCTTIRADDDINNADADISMFPLGGHTLGVQITSFNSSKTQEIMQSFVGRALQQQQQRNYIIITFLLYTQ